MFKRRANLPQPIKIVNSRDLNVPTPFTASTPSRLLFAQFTELFEGCPTPSTAFMDAGQTQLDSANVDADNSTTGRNAKANNELPIMTSVVSSDFNSHSSSHERAYYSISKSSILQSSDESVVNQKPLSKILESENSKRHLPLPSPSESMFGMTEPALASYSSVLLGNYSGSKSAYTSHKVLAPLEQTINPTFIIQTDSNKPRAKPSVADANTNITKQKVSITSHDPEISNAFHPARLVVANEVTIAKNSPSCGFVDGKNKNYMPYTTIQTNLPKLGSRSIHEFVERSEESPSLPIDNCLQNNRQGPLQEQLVVESQRFQEQNQEKLLQNLQHCDQLHQLQNLQQEQYRPYLLSNHTEPGPLSVQKGEIQGIIPLGNSTPAPTIYSLQHRLSQRGLWEVCQKTKKGFYYCIHCPTPEESKFQSIADLVLHLDSIRIEPIYKCEDEQCPWNIVGFYKRSEWKRHIKHQHSDTAMTCSFKGCKKQFTRLDSLKRHTKLVHENANSRKNRAERKKAENGIPKHELT